MVACDPEAIGVWRVQHTRGFRRLREMAMSTKPIHLLNSKALFIGLRYDDCLSEAEV